MTYIAEDVRALVRDEMGKYYPGTYRPGLYYSAHTGGDSSQTPNNETMYATPFPVLNTVRLDRIGIEVIITGEAGSLIRLGIYSDDTKPGWYPGAKVLDAGTVDGTSVSRQEITIDQTLQPGMYWLVLAVQAAPTTQPTVKMTSGYAPGFGGISSDNANLFRNGFKENSAGTPGALPATFPTTESSSRAAKIYVRVAA